MKAIQTFENRVLEQLNASKNVLHFLTTVIELCTEVLNTLILKVFRKDDYAVKYAVEPLLYHAGPLSELAVRIKLMYGLGIITRYEYEDIELLLTMRDQVVLTCREYDFMDEEMLGTLNTLHCVGVLPPIPHFLQIHHKNTCFSAIQQQRYRQMIHSTLVLSITTLMVNISVKQPSCLSPFGG